MSFHSFYQLQVCLFTDIDECAKNNGECEQRCVNDPGGYHCECDHPLYLTSDGKHCERRVPVPLPIAIPVTDTSSWLFKPYL